MKILVLAVFSVLLAVMATPANAACDATEISVASAIQTKAASYTPPAYSGPAPIWLIGDSHLSAARAGAAVPVGHTISGHPLLFAGIPGATISDVLDCYPIAAIAGTNPVAAAFMMGFNDAYQSVCCTGSVPYPVTPSEIATITAAVSLVKTVAPTVIIASDPSQFSGATVDLAYRVYSVSRQLRTEAQSQGLRFLDFYKSAPSTNCYVPYPYCQVAAGALPDNIHYPVAQYKLIVDQIMLALGYDSGL